MGSGTRGGSCWLIADVVVVVVVVIVEVVVVAGCLVVLVGRLLVSFEVKSQVVGTGEAALAVDALERLSARMLAVVARQLVGTGKSPLTSFP